MGAIVSTAIARIRALIPESADRWSDGHIRNVVHQAHMLVSEMCETTWATHDITLVPNALYYALPNDAVYVGAVLHSVDGTNFTDYVLAPCTLTDLDKSDRQWRDRTGTRPTHYGLLGAPGQDDARLLLWPKLASVTTNKVRVVYLAGNTGNNLAFLSASHPDWIIDDVYVPLTVGLLYGTADPGQAGMYVNVAAQNMKSAKARFTSQYIDGLGIEPAKWLSRLGGQL